MSWMSCESSCGSREGQNRLTELPVQWVSGGSFARLKHLRLVAKLRMRRAVRHSFVFVATALSKDGNNFSLRTPRLYRQLHSDYPIEVCEIVTPMYTAWQ
jgi:hypothetical protein